MELITRILHNFKPQLKDDYEACIISHHHKIRPIRDNTEAKAFTFRKADLIDLTGGHIRYNLPQSIISETEQKYPRGGFTRMILKKACTMH